MENNRSVLKLIESLRLGEILLMTGFSFIGMLFSPWLEQGEVIKTIAVILLVLSYVMSVYFLNSFADYEKDIKTTRLNSIGRVPQSVYLKLLVLTTIIFSVLAISINYSVTILSLISLSLWFFYYIPSWRLKSTFLLGTLAHFIGGILHFHIGYSSYAMPDAYSIAVAVYFALLLCMGHANHEIIDYETDKQSGIKTTTVRIGPSPMRNIRTIFAGIAVLQWILVHVSFEEQGWTEFATFLIPTIVILFASILLNEYQAIVFQRISRRLFLSAGLIFLIENYFGQ
jgi:4-hydroxybenzoate polyprenyltransferase